MDEMVRVLRFIVGGFFWLFAIFTVIAIFGIGHLNIMQIDGLVVSVALGWWIFPLKPKLPKLKLPTYDASTYEDSDFKP